MREAINRHPFRAAGTILGVLLLALLPTLLRDRGGRSPATRLPNAYFTADDGATVFEESGDKVAPFEHDGRTAVRAYCATGPDGKRHVEYLEKWTERGRKVLESPLHLPTDPEDLLIKRPGDATWVTAKDPRAPGIMSGSAH